MSKVALTASAVVLLIITVTPGRVARAKTKTITGRIVAYRSVERVFQVASLIPNRELFLFKIEPSDHKGSHLILEINYEHLGYSDITERMLENAVLLKLRVTRARTCDQSYDQFVSTAPVLRDQESGKVTMSGIDLTERFKDIKLAPDSMFQCYALQSGDFEVIGD